MILININFSGACENYFCGANAECIAENHVSKCICHNGYEGDARDVTVGCRPKSVLCKSSNDCPTNTYCYGDTCKRKLLSFTF